MTTYPFRLSLTLDSYEHSTLVCSLIHYALSVFDPSECVRCLDKIAPKGAPWGDHVLKAREERRAAFDRAEAQARNEGAVA